MRVLLVRHGRAGNPDKEQWPNDLDRPLTTGGVKRLVRASKGLRKAGKPERALVAPSTRTQQTAEVLRQHANWPKAKKSDLLKDGAAPADLIPKLNELHERGVQVVGIVGHEPHLSALASFMLTAQPFNNGSRLKKGGAASIDYHPQPGSSQLEWMMPAKALAKLGKLKKFSANGEGKGKPEELVQAGA